MKIELLKPLVFHEGEPGVAIGALALVLRHILVDHPLGEIRGNDAPSVPLWRPSFVGLGSLFSDLLGLLRLKRPQEGEDELGIRDNLALGPELPPPEPDKRVFEAANIAFALPQLLGVILQE